jgi:hypothetical protein
MAVFNRLSEWDDNVPNGLPDGSRSWRKKSQCLPNDTVKI